MAASIGLATSPPVPPGDVPPIRRADTLPATTPWNLEESSKPPGCEWREGKEVRSLLYEGEPYQGKSMHVGSATMPMLFVNGGTDFAYPSDSQSENSAFRNPYT
jgi:hypothetical protein